MDCGSVCITNASVTWEVRDVEILPDLKKTLLIVCKLSDDGYTTVFQPQNGGIMMHGPNDINLVVS